MQESPLHIPFPWVPPFGIAHFFLRAERLVFEKGTCPSCCARPPAAEPDTHTRHTTNTGKNKAKCVWRKELAGYGI